jgi:hypothetical protein
MILRPFLSWIPTVRLGSINFNVLDLVLEETSAEAVPLTGFQDFLDSIQLSVQDSFYMLQYVV